MNINQLPNSFEGIAATYIPQVDDRTQFMKDVEYNMKVLSGLNPSISKEEITEQTNLQYEEDYDVGTEKALLNINDPEIIRSLGEQIFTFGTMNKNNKNISLTDYYTGSVLADNLSDDVLRINVSNTEEDIPQYMTKYNYLHLKIAEAMNNLEPNVTRMAARFIGQPALGMGLPIAGAKIGAGLGGPVGAALGYGIGSFAAHGSGQAWDVGVLGDTIYNTELQLNNMMRDTLTTNADFATAVDEYVEYLKTIPPEYQYEAYKSLLEGPDPFADAGGPFTGLGLSTSIKPFRGALGMLSPILPRFRSDMLKRAQLNQELVKKIQDFKKNEIVKEDVDANVASKVIEQHNADTPPEVVDTVIGIEQNKAHDSLRIKNSNEDSAFFDNIIDESFPGDKLEDVTELEKSISAAAPENKSIMSEADVEKEWEAYYGDRAPEDIRKQWFNADSYGRYQAKLKQGMSEKRATLEVLAENIMDVSNKLNTDERATRPNKKWQSDERGEIRLGEPEQTVNIIHGRGTSNESMTLEEAQALLQKMTGRKNAGSIRDRRYAPEYNPEAENDYILVSTAGNKEWEGHHLQYRPGTGEGSQYYGGGSYGTLEDSDFVASRKAYLPAFASTSDNASLNVYAIPNPDKHPEMYLYYNHEDNVFAPYIGNFVGSDEVTKIYRDNMKVLESVADDIEKGLNETNQTAKTFEDYRQDALVKINDLRMGLADVDELADLLRENVYGLDKDPKGFRAWEKEYWKSKGVKGLVHEGSPGTTSTNIVIFDEDIATKNVSETLYQTLDKSVTKAYNNAHEIIRSDDGKGYYVLERHSKVDDKPVIIKDGKVVKW